jgi:hypothetical protein
MCSAAVNRREHRAPSRILMSHISIVIRIPDRRKCRATRLTAAINRTPKSKRWSGCSASHLRSSQAAWVFFAGCSPRSGWFRPLGLAITTIIERSALWAYPDPRCRFQGHPVRHLRADDQADTTPRLLFLPANPVRQYVGA